MYRFKSCNNIIIKNQRIVYIKKTLNNNVKCEQNFFNRLHLNMYKCFKLLFYMHSVL